MPLPPGPQQGSQLHTQKQQLKCTPSGPMRVYGAHKPAPIPPQTCEVTPCSNAPLHTVPVQPMRKASSTHSPRPSHSHRHGVGMGAPLEQGNAKLASSGDRGLVNQPLQDPYQQRMPERKPHPSPHGGVQDAGASPARAHRQRLRPPQPPHNPGVTAEHRPHQAPPRHHRQRTAQDLVPSAGEAVATPLLDACTQCCGATGAEPAG